MAEYRIQDGDTIRPATEAEAANLDALAAEAQSHAAEQTVREQSRMSALAKLAALGLTEAEIFALLGL